LYEIAALSIDRALISDWSNYFCLNRKMSISDVQNDLKFKLA